MSQHLAKGYSKRLLCCRPHFIVFPPCIWVKSPSILLLQISALPFRSLELRWGGRVTKRKREKREEVRERGGVREIEKLLICDCFWSCHLHQKAPLWCMAGVRPSTSEVSQPGRYESLHFWWGYFYWNTLVIVVLLFCLFPSILCLSPSILTKTQLVFELKCLFRP